MEACGEACRFLVDGLDEDLSSARLMTHETYLVGKSVCSQLPQRKLDTTILTTTESDFDGNWRLWRRCGGGSRHVRNLKLPAR